jgi:hypothetical protein
MRKGLVGFVMMMGGAAACGPSASSGPADAGADVLHSCAELPTLNAAAIAAARSCDPAAGPDQCQVAVRLSLPCGCQTYVNDGTDVNVLYSEWQAQGCTAAGCTAGCAVETPRVCNATDGGAGVCEEPAP